LKIEAHEERAEHFTESKDISHKKRVTMYKIHVRKWYKGVYTHWTIWRRYNQFLKTHDKLRSDKAPVGKLPPKEYDKLKPDVVASRMVSLDSYLQELTRFKSSCRNPISIAFLEPTQLGDAKAQPDPDADW